MFVFSPLNFKEHVQRDLSWQGAEVCHILLQIGYLFGCCYIFIIVTKEKISKRPYYQKSLLEQLMVFSYRLWVITIGVLLTSWNWFHEFPMQIFDAISELVYDTGTKLVFCNRLESWQVSKHYLRYVVNFFLIRHMIIHYPSTVQYIQHTNTVVAKNVWILEDFFMVIFPRHCWTKTSITTAVFRSLERSVCWQDHGKRLIAIIL